MTEDEIYSALVKAGGVELADFAFFADETNRLTILLGGKNFSGTKIFSAVDSELCAANETYAAARRNGLPA